jgi:hypothetical protein
MNTVDFKKIEGKVREHIEEKQNKHIDNWKKKYELQI